MLANNDVGTIQPIRTLASMMHERGILIHTDAVQAAGKISIDVNELGIDLLSFSAHKLHGPQGVGSLYVRRGLKIAPLIFGGRQENGRRAGTENVAAIAGFGKACELAAARLNSDSAHLEKLRTFFETEIRKRISGAVVNGKGAPRLPNTSNISFPGIDGKMLVINLDLRGVAASTGAACSTWDNQPSHVLIAMGREPDQARSSVRFSLGRDNTTEEIKRAIEILCSSVETLRGGTK
jgi:cysteine desulfurase